MELPLVGATLKTYLVNSYHGDHPDENLRLIDAIMYHGDAERLDAKFPLQPCWLNHGEWSSLYIYKNVFMRTDVFLPHTFVVMSVQSSKLLQGIPCRFMPVKFKAVCSFDPAVELEDYRGAHTSMQEFFMDWAPLTEDPSKYDKDYVEALLINAHAEKVKFPARDLKNIKGKDCRGRRYEVVIYPGMLSENMLLVNSGLLMSENIAKALGYDKYPKYHTVTEINV